MPELAALVPVITALSGAAGAGLGIANAVSSPDKGPDPMIAAKQAQDAADKSRLRGVVGQSTADALTRTSGGANQDFLANLATQQAGTPGMQGEALDMVKQLMSGGGGGAANG